MIGHCIAAFIADPSLLTGAGLPESTCPVLRLSRRAALLPAGTELESALGIVPDPADDPFGEVFHSLTRPLADWAQRLSVGGTVVYVETDYWGGSGTQSAMAWRDGTVRMAPMRGARGPINAALRHLGVEPGSATDRFAALGLDRYRSNDDWRSEGERVRG